MTMTIEEAVIAGLPALEVQALPEAIAANARELDDLRSALKALKEREEVLRAAVLDFLVSIDQDAATDGVVSVSRSTHDRKGVDRARLEALYPRVLADVETSTPVTQIRVKIKG